MKLQSFVQGMVLAAIVLVATQTFAAPVNLVCTRVDDKNDMNRITFDEQSGTALYQDDSPSQAAFTATNIKWSGVYGFKNGHLTDFNLDRISGVLTIANGAIRFNCVAAEKKF